MAQSNTYYVREYRTKQNGSYGYLRSKSLKTWTQGRVTLLGDAAHPMGQGSNMAIEDAIVLANELQFYREESQYQLALKEYEKERVYRTSTVKAVCKNGENRESGSS